MRHAFLICAHNNFQLLERLLHQLDDSDFDCYVHIDKKSGFVDYNHYENITAHSNVYFLRNRISVIWGHVSQIAVTFLLIEEAVKRGEYDYVHFISGVDYPIKSNCYIKDFFVSNYGKEFIGFIPWTPLMDTKIGYYNFFTAHSIKSSWIISKVDAFLKRIQKILNIRHYYDTHQFSKGCNWWSITGKLANDLLIERKEILMKYRFSSCADEMFVQTFVWGNANYKQNIFDLSDEYRGCLRLIDWHRGNPYVWKSKDIEEIMKSEAIFARKFSEDDLNIIDLIKQRLNN